MYEMRKVFFYDNEVTFDERKLVAKVSKAYVFVAI